MSVTSLHLTRIAETELSINPDSDDVAAIEWMELDGEASQPALISEFAGRACYQSFDKPNPKTEATADYLRNIVNVEHFSVLAHASVTYYIEGVSRSLTHELIRHRWPAFSQLSQRYVKLEDDLPIVIPPDARKYPELVNLITQASQTAHSYYVELLRGAEYRGLNGKLARQLARSVLPNAAETRIVVTANLRAWRDLLAQRLPKTADAEIRELAEALLIDLKEYAPEVFADIEAAE